MNEHEQQICPACLQKLNLVKNNIEIKFCPHCGTNLAQSSVNKATTAFAQWSTQYRQIMDPLQRLQFLSQSASIFTNSLAMKARKVVWEQRFKSLPQTQIKQLADLDLQFMQMLVYCSENMSWLNRRRGKKALNNYWQEKYALLYPILKEDQEEIKLVISEEFYHLVYRYLDLCRKDKSFNAFLFGMGKVKPETGYYRMEKQMKLVARSFFSDQAGSGDSLIDYNLLNEIFTSAFTDYWKNYPLNEEE